MPGWLTSKDFPTQRWCRWPAERSFDVSELWAEAVRFTLDAPFELVTLPEGWNGPPSYIDTDSHFLVLRGELVVGGRGLGPMSYTGVPWGIVQGKVHAPDGATFLWWAPQAVTRFAMSSSHDRQSTSRLSDLISGLDTRSLKREAVQGANGVTERLVTDESKGYRVRIVTVAPNTNCDIDKAAGGGRRGAVRMFCVEGRFQCREEQYFAGSFREVCADGCGNISTDGTACSFLVVQSQGAPAGAGSFNFGAAEYPAQYAGASQASTSGNSLVQRALSMGLTPESAQPEEPSPPPPASSSPGEAPAPAPAPEEPPAADSRPVVDPPAGKVFMKVRPIIDDIEMKPNRGAIPEEIKPMASMVWKGPSTHVNTNSKVKKSWLVARYLMKKRDELKTANAKK